MIKRSTTIFMIAKKRSTRLPGKNNLDFNGSPMFIYTLKKLLPFNIPIIFDSDSSNMIQLATSLSPLIRGNLRPEHLRDGDLPSVKIFQNILRQQRLDDCSIINIQANSPSIKPTTISKCIDIMKYSNVEELITIYPQVLKLNGSVWCFSTDRLKNYGDPYTHNPDAYVNDNSVDIHDIEDFALALNQEKLNQYQTY